jgi:hypothetical protein
MVLLSGAAPVQHRCSTRTVFDDDYGGYERLGWAETASFRAV